MSVYTDQGMKVSEPGRAVNLLFCNGRHLKHTKFPSLRQELWRHPVNGRRICKVLSQSSLLPRRSGLYRAQPSAADRETEIGIGASSSRAGVPAHSGRRQIPPLAHPERGRVQDPLPDRRSSSSNRSGADLFNNLQASGAQHIRPGEVFETPKRGPGFTDAPTNRLRKQRSSPYKVPPAYQPSNRVRRSTNLSEQEQVDIPTTPEDEARALVEKGYWVRLLQRAGLLDFGQSKLGAAGKPGPNPFRSGYYVNRLLSQITDWRTVFTVFRDLEPLFDHINISTAFHRLAKVSYRMKVPSELVMNNPVYPRLLVVLKKKITNGKMRSRQLANILWALAKMGHDVEDVIDLLLDEIERTQMATWQDQEISNVVWSLATLGRPHTRLLDAFSREVLRRGMDKLVPQAVSNMVWGFATLDYSNTAFMIAVAEYFANDLTGFATQAVSNILWGCAVLNFYDQDMFNAAALEIQRRISSFNDQEISNCLLAFAKMEHVDVSLLQAFEKDITQPHRVSEFTSQALSNMAWSFATLRWYPEQVLEIISGELHRRIDNLYPQEISVSLWALAKLGYHPGRILVDFGTRIEELVGEFNPQACANTLWALSVLQATQLPCFQKLIERLGSSDIVKVEVLMLHQLFQALMLSCMEARRQNLPDPISAIPDHIYTLVKRVWKETVKHTLSSRFHIDVSNMLRDLGVAHDFEYVTEDGLFSLDIALRGPRGSVAIEVDGPYHFTLNTRQPLGSTIIRRRLLHALGWTVLSVPFYDYYRLGTTSGKMHYIATLLRKVDIEVDLERTLQALEGRAAAAESLGSLELPHGRPSPSDGPSRQDDIASPNLPSFPSRAKQQERAPAERRGVQAASAVSQMRAVAPRPAASSPLSLRRSGAATEQSRGSILRNPLSRPHTRAAGLPERAREMSAQAASRSGETSTAGGAAVESAQWAQTSDGAHVNDLEEMEGPSARLRGHRGVETDDGLSFGGSSTAAMEAEESTQLAGMGRKRCKCCGKVKEEREFARGAASANEDAAAPGSQSEPGSTAKGSPCKLCQSRMEKLLGVRMPELRVLNRQYRLPARRRKEDLVWQIAGYEMRSSKSG